MRSRNPRTRSSSMFNVGGGAPPPDWGPEMQRAMEQVIPKDVATLVKSLVPMMASQAWIFMGKVVNPLQRKVTKDLDQARLAVDCVGALLDQVDRFLTAEERQQMRQMAAELRANFLEAAGESQPG
ncbi:MAG: DUF1844 domain-containing protein [Armatimonadetes bacterium]|nr:DUF1844 domain-containing protein [Armatimonadota bacterium]